MRVLRSFGAIALASMFLLAACSSSTSSPSSSASAGPSTSSAPSSATASQPASGTGTGASSVPASAGPSASIAVVATVPTDQLNVPGRLLICSDIPYPPQEFLDAQGNPVGSDIEIGQGIAARLGLQPQIVNSFFDTIIEALNAGKCDIIISAQNITSDRKKQVDMITYFQAGQTFVVTKGNPSNIKTQQDLCGLSIAAETGTTEVDYLNGTGDFKGQGLSAACTKAGKKPIDVKTFAKDSDALLALQGGQVAAYFADSPVAGYYTVQHPESFELSGLTLAVAKEGISVPKGKPDLEKAIRSALSAMVKDGSYANILQKYGVESGSVFK
ncbi:MAG TPA: ABC transporter substrate-binding protein [Candidatus Saccharimonadales bacterium]|nr:ABC transporter substrate-binding protein [Candidatus Saccharimonadales bacterium]